MKRCALHFRGKPLYSVLGAFAIALLYAFPSEHGFAQQCRPYLDVRTTAGRWCCLPGFCFPCDDKDVQSIKLPKGFPAASNGIYILQTDAGGTLGRICCVGGNCWTCEDGMTMEMRHLEKIR
jgi:hypothetical protein